MELFRSMIDHRKVFVLALNGPASFFNSLGLVPEFGAARTFAQSMGVRRANDFLMFGHKCSVEQMESWGLINRISPAESFHEHVLSFLQEQLEVNDGNSVETKRLQNAPLRGERMLAMFDAAHALSERFVQGVPMEQFRRKTKQLSKASKARGVKTKASL
ncbi:hypothetical protein BDW59DRAFT_158667 [Aspergillus cavernicola]|uniref:ClpP/crotonase-like domain-containing protein n=1 Tax=Aspergillus cavernicola TaxID=176166 RepID=A0ABR4ISV4_9EURO